MVCINVMYLQQLSELFSEVMIGLFWNLGHEVFLDLNPPLRISENDKPENLASDEDAYRVEWVLKLVALMQDLISIYFTQPAKVDVAAALCDFTKLTNNWEALFFLQIGVFSI